MKVYELIALLKEMPSHLSVKMDNGEYLDDPYWVEKDSRDYVIMRNSQKEDDENG